jgi:phage protein D
MALINNIAKPVTEPFIQCALIDAVTGVVYTQLQLFDFQLVLDNTSHGTATIEGVYSVLWKRNNKGGYIHPPPALLPTGKKMLLQFGLKPNVLVFPCEIYNSRIVSTSSTSGYADMIRVQYTLVAASWAMQKAQKIKSWTTGATYSYIAKNIAYSYGFNAVVDPTFKQIDYVLQNKETDFMFLARIATEIGYTFFVDGTTLFFINPLHALETTSGKGVPLLNMDRYARSMDNLTEWVPDNQIDSGADVSRKVFSFNPNTNSVIEATNQYLNFTAFDDEDYKPTTSSMILLTDQAANSYQDASDYARFNALVNAKWITSELKCLGDARIKPGALVNIQGDAIIDGSNGYWFVNNATHHIIVNAANPQMTQYYVTSSVSRDQIYDTNIAVDSVWKEVRSTDSKLISGNWKATRITDDTSEEV